MNTIAVSYLYLGKLIKERRCLLSSCYGFKLLSAHGKSQSKYSTPQCRL